MAFRLKLSQKIGKSARNAALEQISAVEALLAAPEDSSRAVHDSRRSLKRVRSLLAALRPALGEKGWVREDRRCRDIARLLAGTREAHALGETLGELEERFGVEALGAARVPLAAVIDMRRRETLRRAGHLDIPEVLRRLGRARKALTRLPVHRYGADDVLEGIRLTYAEGRRCMERTYLSSDEEAFHEWRKPAQRHLRQMELIARCWPAAFKARIELASEMTSLLGAEHDLWVLRTVAETSLGGMLDEAALESFLALCRLRQQELRDRARPLGELLFAERPTAFHARIEAYWRSAVRSRKTRGQRAAKDGTNLSRWARRSAQSQLH